MSVPWLKVNPITLNHDSSLPPATLTPMCHRAMRTTGPSGPEIDQNPERSSHIDILSKRLRHLRQSRASQPQPTVNSTEYELLKSIIQDQDTHMDMRALLSSNLSSARDPVPEMHEAFFNFIPKGAHALTERKKEDASRNHYLQNRMKLQMKKSQA